MRTRSSHFAAAVAAVSCAVGMFGWAMAAGATVAGVYPGDLIKVQGNAAVYYFDKDWHRRPFPNDKVFKSWYSDFSSVKTLTADDMSQIQLGAPVVYRPGTQLVKIPSIPKVYAVEPNGLLRWIESEATAIALYGPNWSKRVDDVPEAFFSQYREGAPLTLPLWPTGTIVKRDTDGTYFFIDGGMKRPVPQEIMPTLRIKLSNIVTGSADMLSEYADAEAVQDSDIKIIDTAQNDYFGTFGPPQFDFPVQSDAVTRGNKQTLLSFRIANGQAVILHAMSATIGGTIWNSSGYGQTPLLQNLAFIDVSTGENLFGTQQLPSGATSPVTLTFTGAHTIDENSTRIIALVADVSADMPAGTTLSVQLNRSSLSLADGKTTQPITRFFPTTGFPAFNVTIK